MTPGSARASTSALRASATSAAGLSVAMGIGRFVYTPILPGMAAALAMPASHGSWIAAANYLGYFLGAAALTRRPDWTSTLALRSSLVLTVVLLAVMPVFATLPWFLIVRLLAGAASAVVFVCIAQVVPEVEKRGGAAGLVYAGVGAGIALSGASVALAGSVSWTTLWLLAAVGAAVLGVVAWQVQVPHLSRRVHRAETSEHSSRSVARVPARLTWSYLFEGIGYIIIGTYLVAIVAESTGAQTASWVWVVAGIAAVVSPLMWQLVSRRIGLRQALVLAYGVQALAALIPAVGTGVAGGFAGAALFGATFMGITQMTLAQAHRSGVVAAAATLTLVYAFGQLLGPVIVAALPANGYGPAFLLAAGLLAVAGVILGSGRRDQGSEVKAVRLRQ